MRPSGLTVTARSPSAASPLWMFHSSVKRRHGAVVEQRADQHGPWQRRLRPTGRRASRVPRRRGQHHEQDLPQREQRAHDAEQGRDDDVRERDPAAAEHRERDAAQPDQQRQRRPDAAVVERLRERCGAVAPQRHAVGCHALDSVAIAQRPRPAPSLHGAGPQPDLARRAGHAPPPRQNRAAPAHVRGPAREMQEARDGRSACSRSSTATGPAAPSITKVAW